MLAALLVLLAVVALVLALLWACQRRLIYVPFPAAVPPVAGVLACARGHHRALLDGAALIAAVAELAERCGGSTLGAR